MTRDATANSGYRVFLGNVRVIQEPRNEFSLIRENGNVLPKKWSSFKELVEFAVHLRCSKCRHLF